MIASKTTIHRAEGITIRRGYKQYTINAMKTFKVNFSPIETNAGRNNLCKGMGETNVTLSRGKNTINRVGGKANQGYYDTFI
jgi:hypothetical protein